jgi:AcrR family transcriptional regulator
MSYAQRQTPDTRRHSILNATIPLFAAQGFSGATTAPTVPAQLSR